MTLSELYTAGWSRRPGVQSPSAAGSLGWAAEVPSQESAGWQGTSLSSSGEQSSTLFAPLGLGVLFFGGGCRRPVTCGVGAGNDPAVYVEKA